VENKNWLRIPPSAEKKKLETKFSFCRVLRTPNRRLLDRKLIFDFVRPFDLIPKYKEKFERSPAAGGASEPLNRLKKSQCLVWSDLLNAARTFFEQNSDGV